MSETGQTKSDLLIRRADVGRIQSFDTQFWPVVVGLCTLSAFSAGAMVTLLDGAAMWVSLLAVPIAFFMLLLTLWLVDNRKFRRSLQLGLMLSIAIHLLFVILASRVDIFAGMTSPDQNPDSKASRKPRVVEISSRREEQPWREVNEVPTVEPDEVLPEREQATAETPVKPQPVELEPTPPKPEPQLVKRQTNRETVPKQGKSLSQTRRSETNLLPKSTVKTETSSAAASSSKSTSSPERQSEPNLEVAKREPASSSQSSQQRQKSEVAKGIQATELTRRSRRQPTSETATADSLAKRSEQRRASVTPEVSKVAESSTASNQPSQPARESMRAAETEVTRSAPAPSQVTRNRTPSPETNRSPSEQVASPQRRETANTTSVQTTPELRETRRRSMTAAAQPTSPTNVESPRATSQPAASQSASVSPKEFSLNRSTAGTAGVGRSQNMGRQSGSRQSPAMSPMQSARRESQQNADMPTEAFTPSQASRSPGRKASAMTPSSSVVAQSNPAASLAAAPNLQEITENASASVESATTDNHRGEISAEKGEGNADMGANRIVMEDKIDRVEGGGQPELNMLRESHSARSEAGGSQAPSINSTVESNDIAAPFEASSARASEVSQPDAQADVAARSGGSAPASGQRSGQRVEAADQGTSESLASDAIERRQGSSSSELNNDASRSLGSIGRDDDDEDEDAAMPQGNMVAENLAVVGSEERGDGESLERPAMEAQRESNSGTISQGLANATGRTTGATASDSSSVQRRETNNSGPAIDGNVAEAGGQRAGRMETGTSPQVEGNGKVELGNVAEFSDGRGADSTSQLDRETAATRQATDGMSLDIEAPIGAAGLSDRVEIEAGIDSRRASAQSPDLLPSSESRFIREDAGGTPAINPNAIVAKESFSSRRQNSNSAKAPVTEESIELGLEFLARNQDADGSWNLSKYDVDHPEHDLQYHSDTAATGLSLLAFQGAGYNHREFKYADQVAGGIQWLMDNQKTSGNLYVESDTRSDSVSRFYSHGIATLALAEAYGMTQDPEIKAAAQSAVDFIERTQHSTLGGWRYTQGKNSDTSVTGWMVMALKSARLSGLEVKDETFEGVVAWLQSARDVDAEYKFRYRPDAVSGGGYDRSASRIANPNMSSVGLLMRMYLGWNRQDQRLMQGADYLLEHLPSDATEDLRDTYYWYYATQVLKHAGGDRWEKWNSALHPLLLRTQIRDGDMAGSWNPYEPVPDKWGRKGGGRLYVTAMNLLSLEVDYRLLPLYDDTSK